MVKGGMSIKEVAKIKGINVRTLQLWKKRSDDGQSLETKSKPGRKKVLSTRAKIVIAKSIGKKRQSPRKLARRLKSVGEQCSRNTISRYLHKSLGVRPYKQQKKVKLSPKNIKDRLSFANMAKRMSSDDWKKVIFSDESPFPLYWSPNRQVNQIWAHGPEEVASIDLVKKSQGVLVWGAFSYFGLSDLHIMDQNTRLNASNYRTDILESVLSQNLGRKRSSGPPSQRKLVQDRSDFIFQHDGAPAHFAATSEKWLAENVPAHWGKGTWPGNSPDLNPIENLWSILKDRLESRKKKPANIGELKTALKEEWNNITAETIQNLILSMPSRIEAVISSKGNKTVY